MFNHIFHILPTLSLVFILSFFGKSNVYSQAHNIAQHHSYDKISNPTFQRVSIWDGLSSNTATVIYRDHHGFMWFGTRNGLNRYDAYNFEIYKHIPLDSTSLSDNQIRCIQGDSSGTIWIGTAQGIDKYLPGTNEFKRYNVLKDQPINSSVNDILCVDKDVVFVCSNVGLHKIQKESIHEIKNTSLHHGSIPFLCIEPSGNSGEYWLGSFAKGLFKYHDKSGKMVYIPMKGYTEVIVNSLLQNNKSQLLIGTQNSGLLLYSMESKKVNQLLNGAVRSIEKDSDGNIWVSNNENLVLLDPSLETSHIFSHNQNENKSRALGIIYDIFCDPNGIVWLANGISGIEYFDTNQNTLKNHFYPTDANYDNKGFVKAFNFDSNHNLWVGTFGNGIKIYNKHMQTIWPTARLAFLHGKGYITSIINGKDNTIWVGTLKGLWHIDANNYKVISHFTRDDGLWHNDINALISDCSGDIWIATREGLNKWDVTTKKIIKYSEKDGLVYYKARELFVDSACNVWIGTYRGVSSYRPEQKTFINFHKTKFDKKGITDDYITSFCQDNIGNMWIGTNNGLTKYNEATGQVSLYFESDGLLHNTISKLLKDKNGNIWVFYPNEVSYFSPKTMIFNTQAWDDEVLFNHNALIDSNNYICIGEIHSGFYKFQPSYLNSNKNKPPVYITDLKTSLKGYKNVFLKNEIVLPYSENSIEIEFSSLNYLYPQKNRYAYKMKGVQEGWNYASAKNRRINYTNLHWGDYVFMVKGSNNSGVWNNKGDILQITILPPWWQSHLAKLGFIVFLAVTSYTIFLIRRSRIRLIIKIKSVNEKVRLEKESSELKLKYFTDISHEFRTPLTLISLPVDTALADSQIHERTRENLIMVKKNVLRLQNLINQLLDYRKISKHKFQSHPEIVEIIEFIKSIYKVFESSFEKYKLQHRFSSSLPALECLIDINLLDKALYNLMSNAVNHADKNGSVAMDILFTDDRHTILKEIPTPEKYSKINMCITITNTGKGIPEEDLSKVFDRFFQSENNLSLIKGTGIGLSIVKEYIGLLEGHIEVKSKLNDATSFIIHIPIKLESQTNTKPLNKKKTQFEEVILEKEFDYANNLLKQSTDLYGKQNDGDKEMILIVEDNATLRKLINEIFISHFTIIEAENGKTGFEKAVKHLPDIIISDIMMPEMDGIKMCKKCKETTLTCHIPIILLTAKSSEDDELLGIQTGAEAYVTKPFKAAMLNSLVYNILENHNRLKKIYSEKGFDDIKLIFKNHSDKSFMENLDAVIKENIHNDEFNLLWLAQSLHLSRVQLFRKMKAIVNLSPGEYIRNFKMHYAASLLKDTTLTIEEIAYQTGFKSRNVFTRNFSKMFDISPNEYRKKNEG